MLDLIKPFLEDRHIPYVRFDGKMSRKSREEALEEFQEQGSRILKRKRQTGTKPRVILMSLKRLGLLVHIYFIRLIRFSDVAAQWD
jgi:SNF2 family DNA or RNA helicase